MAIVLHSLRYRGIEWSGSGAPAARHVHRHHSPNHLAHEVIDNMSMRRSTATLKTSKSSCSRTVPAKFEDDGRGMPVDIHPKREGQRCRDHPDPPACRREIQRQDLPACGRIAWCRRVGGECAFQAVGVLGAPRGKEYNISFAGGAIKSKLEVGGRCSEIQDRHHHPVLARSEVFSTPEKFAIPKLKQVLRAKAVLCPNLRVTLSNEFTGEKDEWLYNRRPASVSRRGTGQGRVAAGRNRLWQTRHRWRLARLGLRLGAGVRNTPLLKAM